MTRRAQKLLICTTALALVLGVAACGKKGSPRPPEGQESEYTYPQDYPAPNTVTPGGEQAPGQGTNPFSIFTGNDRRTKTKTY